VFRLLLASLFFAQIAFAQGSNPPATSTIAETAAEPVPAGKVDLVEGDVRFFDASRRMRRPKLGDFIYESESIVTGADGEAHLAMEDGGYIGVRPNTRMRIVNYKAEGGADDRSVIGLLQGSFRSVTGWIAKLNARSVEIRTPTATIGVRGTDHEPLVIPEGSAEGEPGTYDRVHIGETEIRTPQGSVSVRPNQAGFVPHRGAARPRVLERVPAFYRPTRNEKRFEGLHERIHRQIEQRRIERVMQVEEKRKKLQQRREQGKAAAQQRQEQRRQQVQEQRREQAQKQRSEHQTKQSEERRHQAEKAGQEREQKRHELAEKQHGRKQAEAERKRKQKEHEEEREHVRRHGGT